MRLISLEIKNFRSLKQVTIPFERLSVLIGENDSGKSSVLDILEMVFSSHRPDDKDFFYQTTNQQNDDSIEAIVELEINEQDTNAQLFAVDNKVKIRKYWKRDSVEIYYWGNQPEDSRLRQDFTKMRKPELEALIEAFDPDALSKQKTNDDRVKWLEESAEKSPKKAVWLPFPQKQSDFLPRFERYKAIDYSSPENFVMKTLRQVYEQTIFQDVANRQLDSRLIEIKERAEEEIKNKVGELLDFVRRYADKIQDISFDPSIDFSSGLKSGEFQVDDGRGLHYLSNVGDGTKRRMWMAVLDWDKNISVSQSSQGQNLPLIIRGYDEPDTNLHYEAQRVMYQAISDITYSTRSNIQTILCTHSLTMIDRAPTKSINLLRINNGSTSIERLETEDDEKIEFFLKYLAQQLGITNTIMFYEKCFVLVEGETEENALPIIYQNIYQRSLLEDGIRIINLKGNGATGEFLKLLGKNRQELTVVFLDKDTEVHNQGKRAKLTKDAFKQSGFSEDFISTKIIYIGEAEFEDAFSDAIIVDALNLGYPRDGMDWDIDHISEIRGQNGKFSDNIKKSVKNVTSSRNDHFRKPEFGKHLGRVCTCKEKVPRDVLELFNRARQIARCE